MKLIEKYKVLLLFIASFVLATLNLGKWALMDFDEATYAQVFHEANTSGNFVSFTYLEKPWHEKPPLLFWLINISTKIFKQSEFGLRLPSALLIMTSTVLIYLITKNIWSSLVLMTTGFFIFAGKQVRMDIPVTAAILFSFWGFIKGLQKPKWFLIFGIGFGIAVLFKSVIGLLIFPIVGIYSIVFKEWSYLNEKWFWIAIFLGVSVLLPWHIYETIKFGFNFWDTYIGVHVINRITETVTTGGETPSIIFYLSRLFTLTQPWLIVFLGLGLLIRHKDKFATFAFITTLFLLIIFLIPQTKLLYYWVVALPFMAMFIGHYFSKLHKGAIFALLLLGLTNTILQTTNQSDREFFLNTSAKPSRYQIAEVEKDAVLTAIQKDLPLYTYRWQFFPTLNYYNRLGNGIPIQQFTNLDNTKRPFLVLVPTPLSGKFSNAGNILMGNDVALLIEIK